MPAVILDPPREPTVTSGHLPEKWWRSFFESSEDAQVVCRSDGLAVKINPKAARLLKVDGAMAEGDFCVFDVLVSPADQKLRESLEHGCLRPDALHSVTLLAGGRQIGMADLELAPLDEHHTLVTFKDIARRMRLESHVNRLVTAIDATPDVFFLTNADGRITFVNPAFHTVTGYDIEAVLDHTDEFLRAPSEAEKVRAYLEHVSQGREWIGELTNLRHDGTAYQVEATVSPITDMTGQFIGYVACERDITTRKKLEGDLRLQHDFVRSILHSLDGAIYSLDREFRVTHANDGWRHLHTEHGGIRLDGPPELGRPLLDYVAQPARRSELAAIFQEVLASGQAQDNQYEAPDGHHWLVKISPWIHAGDVRGLICSVTDQTHYHELQSQLFQSQKMEIIGTLAAGVAHDFNNLLQAIRGNTSLVMMEAPQNSDMYHWGEQINLAATRAAEITQQLLSFSRRSEEKRFVLDLNQVVREAIQLARRTLRANVNLEIVPAPDAVPVKIEFSRATQTLLNLCVNAQDAMPEGGTLTLTNAIVAVSPGVAARHDMAAGGEFARCSVADTGCGIPANLLPRIFEAFFSTKEKGRGTGLGLSIVHRIMREAGGFVDVESAVGRGTTFHLYFPLSLENLAATSKPVERPLPHGKGRVLVVDDLDLLRDFAKTFLETTGLTVLVAASGQEALQLLEKEKGAVDILFTDYAMPGMNGADLIEQIAVRWPLIRPVLASGYLEEPIVKRLEGLNTKVLTKPYEMQEAAKVLIDLLPKKA
jgi:two-component system, cell cycle sensor histidine kinase and response regulator CckA